MGRNCGKYRECVSDSAVLRGGRLLLLGWWAVSMGAWAMALAEIVDTIPIFSRRRGLKGGLGILVVLMALGRSIGGILHFYMRW